MRILLVEDDRAVRITVKHALEDAGYEVTAQDDGDGALTAMGRETFDLLMSDVRLPGVDGISLFRHLRRLQPDCEAILMTAYVQLPDAVTVMREGAYDYIGKPFELDELLLRIKRLEETMWLRHALSAGDPDAGEDRIVGQSPAIRLVLNRIDAAAAAGTNVLVSGETGTGKELAARALHRRSARAKQPFIHVNCAAFPSDLFETEMFGHERGAFTGAHRRRDGRLAAANGGTLFLDEVGELALDQQAKLLRVLDSGTFEPVGSSKPTRVDVWMISATNRDLRARVEEGRFRQDLFFRLNVFEIEVPPLRERRNDIPLLVCSFLRDIAARRCMAPPKLSPAAVAALVSYHFPGNVRELLHVLERAVALARDDEISLEHLPDELDSLPPRSRDMPIPLAEAVRQFEQIYIQRVLDQAGGKRKETAKALGISRKSLWQKLKQD